MLFYKKLWMSVRKRIFLLLGKRFFVKKVKGLTFLLDMKNRVDRQVDAFSKYETPQIEFLFSLLKKNKCSFFIDIGSHWGYYSLLFANDPDFNSAKIYAFEPDAINRNQLYANLFLNKLQDRIQVYEQAISSEEGETRFHHFADNNRGRSCVAEDGEIVVKTTRLDSVVNVENQTLGIKIDVEGHELGVIDGMKTILSKNKCILQIESFEELLPDLTDLMSDLGYKKILTIHADHYFVNN